MLIELNNFQGHSETKIEVSGMTIITGKSNAGKSSIIRGLLWLMQNKPTGSAFVKHGKSYASVVLDGLINRHRSKKDNIYSVVGMDEDEKRYEAIKTDVPKVVQDYINIVPANIQRQKDVFFLVDQTPTQAGAFLDETLHLTDIGNMEAACVAKATKATKELNEVKICLEKVKAEKESLGWLENANKLLEKLKLFQTNLLGWANTIATAEAYQAKIDIISAGIKDLDWIEPIPRMFVSLQGIKDLADTFDDKIQRAEELIAQRDAKTADLKWMPFVDKTVEKWKELVLAWQKDDQAWEQVKKLQQQGQNAGVAIASGRARLVELKKQLPRLCPTCGQPWEGK